MYASDFDVQLNLVDSGLMRSIEDQLLRGEMENKGLRAEVYELNAYGEHHPEVPPRVTMSNATEPV